MVAALLLDSFIIVDQIAVVRFYRQGKAKIGQGVLMAAINARRSWQRCKFHERGVQLVRVPLKQPAAAPREQGITAEHMFVADEGHVARRVAWNVKHPVTPKPVKRHRVAFLHPVGDPGNGLRCRSIDRYPMGRHQRPDPAAVVAMVMGAENGGEGEVMPVQRLLDGFGRPGVDRDHPRSGGVGHQPDIVVAKRRDV